MGNNIKTWSIVIGSTVTILLSVIGYIYAEATGSRSRDIDIRQFAAEEHKEMRESIYNNQIIQMSMLSEITKNVSIVMTDVGHLKESR